MAVQGFSVTPPISQFFGLDPNILGGPAANSSMINQLLVGSSFQMVPINFGPPTTGIPPIFGGQGFTGFPSVPFNVASPPPAFNSPFAGGAAFSGTGFGTQPFGVNVPNQFGLFGTQSIQPNFQGFGAQPFGLGGSMVTPGFGQPQFGNPFIGAQFGGFQQQPQFGFQQQSPFGFNGVF